MGGFLIEVGKGPQRRGVGQEAIVENSYANHGEVHLVHQLAITLRKRFPSGRPRGHGILAHDSAKQSSGGGAWTHRGDTETDRD